MAKRDYYETLGVEKSADDADLKKAYRRLAMKYHPDKTKGDKASEERFKKISEAYAVLSDEEKRKQYDTFGTVGDMGPQGGPNINFEGFDFDGGGGAAGYGDLFDSFFRIDPLAVIPPYGPRNVQYWALFEDNDPDSRMLVLLNLNTEPRTLHP